MTLADLTPLALPFILGYALGAIPFGLLLTRLFGAGDIRAIGSGNIGATNVLRTGRKGLAVATLLLDGGKGVATMLGISFGLDWRLGVICALLWLAVALLTKISSAGGMASAVAAPVVLWLLHESANWWLLVPMALLILWNHRANITRLRAGTEPRIGQKG